MSAPDTVVQTTTTTAVDHPGDDHDGLLPEPEQKSGTPLWYALIGTLCIVLLLFAGVFAYLAWRGSIGSDALVGLFGMVLASLMALYRRQS
jgi:hypothetical protein